GASAAVRAGACDACGGGARRVGGQSQPAAAVGDHPRQCPVPAPPRRCAVGVRAAVPGSWCVAMAGPSRAVAGADRTGGLLRRAVLSLDSDVALEPQLLTVAGWRASELLDLRLAERLAGASCSAGGGFEAHLLMALVLFWRGRCDEADVELDAVYHLAATDA